MAEDYANTLRDSIKLLRRRQAMDDDNSNTLIDVGLLLAGAINRLADTNNRLADLMEASAATHERFVKMHEEAAKQASLAQYIRTDFDRRSGTQSDRSGTQAAPR